MESESILTSRSLKISAQSWYRRALWTFHGTGCMLFFIVILTDLCKYSKRVLKKKKDTMIYDLKAKKNASEHLWSVPQLDQPASFIFFG